MSIFLIDILILSHPAPIARSIGGLLRWRCAGLHRPMNPQGHQPALMLARTIKAIELEYFNK
jgi:hypothetical protein